MLRLSDAYSLTMQEAMLTSTAPTGMPTTATPLHLASAIPKITLRLTATPPRDLPSAIRIARVSRIEAGPLPDQPAPRPQVRHSPTPRLSPVRSGRR